MECDTAKITKQLLKTLSGEFELESIRIIDLSGLNIKDLGEISLCTCLEKLDLSRNDISDLRPLAPLKQLTFLSLAVNSVTYFDILGELDSLKTLNLAGNLIKSFDSLKCLRKLSGLESLRLQEGRSRNPICDDANYHSTIKAVLPNLKTLDGERVTGAGSDVYRLIHEIQQQLEDSDVVPCGMVVPSPSPWILPGEFLSSSDVQSCDDEAERHLRDLLRECNDLNSAAERCLKEV